MKLTKCILSCLMLTAFALSLFVIPAFADNNVETETICFEDGSYLVVKLVLFQTLSTRASSTRSGIKTGEYYNSAGDILWDFSVHGTFTYDGTTATAISASYSYNIYNSAWTLKSASASCSGNQAIAEAKFNGGFLLNRSTSITLTCSGTGVLS